MEIKESHQAGFKLKNISLEHSSFQKDNVNNISKLSLNLERGYKQEENGDLTVYVSVDLRKEESGDFHISASMFGRFEIKNIEQLSVDAFAKVNAAAIIYPYLREHIRWLSLQANLVPPVLLPVVNFHSIDSPNTSAEKDQVNV